MTYEFPFVVKYQYTKYFTLNEFTLLYLYK